MKGGLGAPGVLHLPLSWLHQSRRPWIRPGVGAGTQPGLGGDSGEQDLACHPLVPSPWVGAAGLHPHSLQGTGTQSVWFLQNKTVTVSNQALEPPKNVEYSLSGPWPADQWAAFLGRLPRHAPDTSPCWDGSLRPLPGAPWGMKQPPTPCSPLAPTGAPPGAILPRRPSVVPMCRKTDRQT